MYQSPVINQALCLLGARKLKMKTASFPSTGPVSSQGGKMHRQPLLRQYATVTDSHLSKSNGRKEP